MEMDPEKINDAERQVEAKIFEIGSAYAESNAADKVKNKKRAENRKKIGDLGLRVDAYQIGVKIVKDLTTEEIKDYLRDLKLVVKVLGGRQAELFPEEKLKAEARSQRAKDRAKKLTGKEGAPDPDSNPRSDPKSGGAGKRPRKPKAVKEQITIHDTVAAGDALISSTAAQLNAAAEQAEGDAYLSGMLDKTKERGANEHTVPETEGEDATGLTGKTGFGSISDEKPLSQGEIARQKREAALGSEG